MEKRLLSHLETADLCRSLALLLHAGAALGDGLFLLAREEGLPREVLEELGRRLDAGAPLSEALAESGCFPPYVASMVRVGEESGRLEQALEALADYYQERERLERQVRSALAYPAMILLLMLAVVAVLLIRVLPVFDEVYASLGGHLTGLAGGLLGLGRALEAAMPVFLVLAAAAALGVLLFSCCPPFREKALRLWRVGFGDRGLSRLFNNARFARALAMGLDSGLALESSVELAGGLLTEVPGAAERANRCESLLREGTELGKALESCGLLPPAFCRMLSLGLRSGSGDRAMEEIARRMEDEASRSLEDTVSRVEPAMVLVMSVLVGAILLSVMLPLMNIMAAIG